MTADDEITLRGMRFHACVGILPHERELPQPLEIDITVWKRAGGDVVDYRHLYEIAQRTIDAGDLYFLERIGERIADAALREQPVWQVRVAVRKPHVPLPGPLDYAEVVVTRTQDA